MVKENRIEDKKDVMSHISLNCQINQISQQSIKRIQVELGIKTEEFCMATRVDQLNPQKK